MSVQAVTVIELESNLKTKKQQKIDELILSHRENGRKLARSLLRRWRVRMPAEETDSIVDLTLCEAAKRFDPNRGASFTTFLFYHLRGNLVRSIAALAKTSNMMVNFKKVTGVDVDEWGSLEEKDCGGLLPDFGIFGYQVEEGPERTFLRFEKADACSSAVSTLDPLEQAVINRAYVEDETLVDIAQGLGYSRCHVSRIKKRALKKLSKLVTDYAHEYRSDPNEVAVITRDGAKRKSARRRNRSVVPARHAGRVRKVA